MDEEILENVENIENDGFYMKINSELKKQFNIKCLENDTKMATEIKRFMEDYIKNN